MISRLNSEGVAPRRVARCGEPGLAPGDGLEAGAVSCWFDRRRPRGCGPLWNEALDRAMVPPMAKRRRAPKKTTVPAKISVPHLTETYRRARLFRALDAARRRRIVWISGPAGAGKTSLVTTYLA